MCGYVYYKSNVSNLFPATNFQLQSPIFQQSMNIGCAFSLKSEKSLHAMHKNVFASIV